ncbi:hypothetical protein TNCV_2895071 [Trichonephila clavipes]|nr:hypothetical protein TNCV_2895071 [Trichonephila clavipes]
MMAKVLVYGTEGTDFYPPSLVTLAVQREPQQSGRHLSSANATKPHMSRCHDLREGMQLDQRMQGDHIGGSLNVWVGALSPFDDVGRYG